MSTWPIGFAKSLPQLLWTHHSEQFRKAWFAGFPPHLWPAQEQVDTTGRICLQLKDGTKLMERIGKDDAEVDELLERYCARLAAAEADSSCSGL